MKTWAEVERDYNSMDPETRALILGMLEAWAWDQPDEGTRKHRFPVTWNYDGRAELSAMFPTKEFKAEDFTTVVQTWDSEASLWWFKFSVEKGDLQVEMACTETNSGIPDEWDDRPPFIQEEWEDVFNRWKEWNENSLAELRVGR